MPSLIYRFLSLCSLLASELLQNLACTIWEEKFSAWSNRSANFVFMFWFPNTWQNFVSNLKFWMNFFYFGTAIYVLFQVRNYLKFYFTKWSQSISFYLAVQRLSARLPYFYQHGGQILRVEQHLLGQLK